MTAHTSSRRRWFRFRLRSLLALPLVFALSWCWVTWPERTVRRYCELLAAKSFDGARSMSDLRKSSSTMEKICGLKGFTMGKPLLVSPTWRAWLLGERQFVIPWNSPTARGDLRGFVARRGHISLTAASGDSISISYLISNSSASAVVNALASYYGPEKSTAPVFQFSSDLGQNRVITSAPDSATEEVRALIEALDVPPPETKDALKIHLNPGVSKDDLTKALGDSSARCARTTFKSAAK